MLTLPAIEMARRGFSSAHVAVLVAAENVPLLENNPHIDEIVPDSGSDSPRELGAKLRSGNYDAAVVINSNSRNCLAVWHAAIPHRVCWAYKPAGFIFGNRLVRLHRNRPPIHEAEFASAFVKQLGVSADLSDCRPELAISKKTINAVRCRIVAELGSKGPLFGVHPGNKKSAYNWPPHRYAQLVRCLAKRGRVMISGAPHEAQLLEQVTDKLPFELQPRVATFSDFTLPELVAAISLQDVLTISSTGPMHMAGVLGTPTAALFSGHRAHLPEKWAPLGDRHLILLAPLKHGEKNLPTHQGSEYMSRISVDEVVEANRICLDKWPRERSQADASYRTFRRWAC